MINISDIISNLPLSMKNAINFKKLSKLQEIRIKVNKPVIIQDGCKEIVTDYVTTCNEIKSIIQRMSNYSVYAYDEDIKQGYITVKGGHRVGICGRCIIENNKVKTIKDAASLNIRICRQVLNCSDKLMKYIIKDNRIKNTIIISPPKCGKTTMIRDMCRNISDGIKRLDLDGKKVCVIDERSEIGACFNGVPQLNIGLRTDILDSCPKSEGIIMAIRSMSPEVIICDEIGTLNDVEAMINAMNSGVNLVSTIHGYGIEDLKNRKVFNKILDNKIFKIAIVLNNSNGPGSVEYIFDFEQNKKIAK